MEHQAKLVALISTLGLVIVLTAPVGSSAQGSPTSSLSAVLTKEGYEVLRWPPEASPVGNIVERRRSFLPFLRRPKELVVTTPDRPPHCLASLQPLEQRRSNLERIFEVTVHSGAELGVLKNSGISFGAGFSHERVHEGWLRLRNPWEEMILKGDLENYLRGLSAEDSCLEWLCGRRRFIVVAVLNAEDLEAGYLDDNKQPVPLDGELLSLVGLSAEWQKQERHQTAMDVGFPVTVAKKYLRVKEMLGSKCE